MDILLTLVGVLGNAWSAFSQLLNVIFLFGHSNDISGRCYREGWIIPMKIINGIFFWQNHHCRGAYSNDREWAEEYLALPKRNPEAD